MTKTRAMPLVARVTFVVLVVATFAAFFVAQRLKSSAPVIDVKGLARFYSPNGDGKRDVNDFSLVLRTTDDATVDVVDSDGDPVKRLADNVHVIAYRPLRLAWRGDTDAGTRAPDGEYRLRVSLRDEGRSAVVQQTIDVDTRAPQSQVCIGIACNKDQTPNVVAPGEQPIKVYINGVSPTYPTQFKVWRTDGGKPRVVDQFDLAAGHHLKRWTPATPLEPGTYLIQSQVRDRAGNVGVSPARLEVGTVRGRPGLTVRGIGAQLPVQPFTAGQRVSLYVDARKKPFRWSIRRVGEMRIRDRGTSTDPHLSFTAPKGSSGAYLLKLQSTRFHIQVPFLVQATKRSSVLVVVPTITWLGVDEVDDPPFDGLPNTLTDGGVVHWPRVLNGTGGLPEGFADQVAPLLVFLDRHRIRYDLTSDIDLDLSRNPRATDRPGVLFAGSERWISRSLAKRLRSFVLQGGRVATFGTDTLRRYVSLRTNAAADAGTLSHPTSETPTDPFGAHVGKTQTFDAPVTLSQFDGDPAYGLMEGATDLPGFTELEESAPVSKPLAAVGQTPTDAQTQQAEAQGKTVDLKPALTATSLGKGVVIRVGLPQWAQRLGDANVAQVTRNIVDILRKVQPRIRSAR